MHSKQMILKKGVVRTEPKESTWRIRIKSLSLELSHVNTKIFVIFFVKIEIFDLHAVSIFATGTGESYTSPFCKLWNTINWEIINAMTIVMKTIKQSLNLYTKYILMGWGPVYFDDLHLLSLQVTYSAGTRRSMNKM